MIKRATHMDECTLLTLRPGDHAALVSPAGQLRTADRHWLDDAVQLLLGWGLQVDVRVESDHHFYLAGDDKRRAGHLVASLTDESIRAVFCARGGYGSARLWPWLQGLENVPPKLLVGFSDITSLHSMAMSLWPGVECVLGPNLATRQIFGDSPASQQNRDALKESLFAPRSRAYSVRPIVSGHAEGVISGGCLSILCTTLGTPYQIETAGKIVLLEDTGESPYKIDRMLVHLRNAGVLEGVSGVAFGEMPGCTDPYNNLDDVIGDVLGDLGVPIVSGLPTGHGDANNALRLNQLVKLDADHGLVTTSGLSDSN